MRKENPQTTEVVAARVASHAANRSAGKKAAQADPVGAASPSALPGPRTRLSAGTASGSTNETDRQKARQEKIRAFKADRLKKKQLLWGSKESSAKGKEPASGSGASAA